MHVDHPVVLPSKQQLLTDVVLRYPPHTLALIPQRVRHVPASHHARTAPIQSDTMRTTQREKGPI